MRTPRTIDSAVEMTAVDEVHTTVFRVDVDQRDPACDALVEQVAAPVVERAVAAGLFVRVDRHLEEARDDEVVAIIRHPLVEVDVVAADAVADAVAVRIRDGVGDGVAINVDGVHVLGTVAPARLDGRDLPVADDVCEAVRADQIEVSRRQRQRQGIHVDARLRSHSSRDHRAMWMLLCLLRRQAPGAHELAHERVIVGQLL
jgi:hypothetical protein